MEFFRHNVKFSYSFPSQLEISSPPLRCSCCPYLSCFFSSRSLRCSRRWISARRASSSRDSSAAFRAAGISRRLVCCSGALSSDSSKPSLKERLLCPSAFANCGNLLPPKSRKITPTTRSQIIGFSGRNSMNICVTPHDNVSKIHSRINRWLSMRQA